MTASLMQTTRTALTHSASVLLLAAACTAVASPASAARPATATVGLVGIEERIGAAYSEALRTRSAAPLIAARRALDSSPSTYWRGYWTGYLLHHLALARLQAGDQAGARRATEEAITVLEAVRPADREVQTLLALTTGLNLAFVPPARMLAEVDRSTSHLRRAQAGPPALRPLYVAAVSDWNTPAQFGGRRAAEQLLRQALALPPEPRRPIAPGWGRAEATALLAQVLTASGRREEAAQLILRGRAEFPNNAALSDAARR